MVSVRDQQLLAMSLHWSTERPWNPASLYQSFSSSDFVRSYTDVVIVLKELDGFQKWIERRYVGTSLNTVYSF